MWMNRLPLILLLMLAAPVVALPVFPSDVPEIPADLAVAEEQLPPLAELDVPSLRSWMNKKIGPTKEVLDIDPGEWPLLEFRPPHPQLELRLDDPALFERHD
jgi:hypothetical protein